MSASLVALLLANLLPLLGSLVLGWDVRALLALYWLESAVVGFWSLCRILACRPDGAPVPAAVRLLMGGFFAVHFGIFMLVHGMFLFTMLGSAEGLRVGGPADAVAGLQAAQGDHFGLALLGLFVSHGVSFFANYLGRGEYRTTSPAQEMMAPYGRILVMHFVVMAGGFLLLLGGLGAVLAVLLAVVKTGVDLAAHRREHRRRAAVLQPG